MTKNTQALILFFASQLSWMVCCAASAPAFITTTYEQTPLQWALMLNGIAIVGSGTFLMLLAILVAMSKKEELSPKKLDPKFSIGMGVTAFMLIAQVIIAMGHVAMQPDEADFVTPAADSVPTFQVWTTLTDGQEAGGAYGFAMPHPDDGRPIFVTVSQQFGMHYGLDRDLSNEDVFDQVESAYVVSVTAPGERIAIGAPIRFTADAFLASGSGMVDPMSDVMFFEAPALKDSVAKVQLFGGLDKAPTGQILWAITDEAATVEELKFSYDLEDLWEVDANADADIVAGTPILDYKQRVVGFVSRVDDTGLLDVFPVGTANKYLD